MKHANLIKRLIKESLATPPKKESCNCGCHSCENVGNKGPVLNESLDARVVMTENMKYHVKNKLPLTENKLKHGSEEFLNLWAEARYLYSRNAIHLNEEDKATILETNLGEYGMYDGEKIPLDIPILENESKSGGLKKFYVYTRNSKTKNITRKPLNEDSASKVYKIEGLLVTNNDIKFQNQLLSDIRSVTGVTTIDAQEYTPRIRKENYSYNKLSVKVDPYPYLKNGGKFDIDTIKQVITNIGNIKGVVKFKVDNPQMINVGL